MKTSVQIFMISLIYCGTFFSGETTRKGFYLYDDKRKASPDPELKKYVEKARDISGVSIDPKVSLSTSHNNRA